VPPRTHARPQRSSRFGARTAIARTFPADLASPNRRGALAAPTNSIEFGLDEKTTYTCRFIPTLGLRQPRRAAGTAASRSRGGNWSRRSRRELEPALAAGTGAGARRGTGAGARGGNWSRRSPRNSSQHSPRNWSGQSNSIGRPRAPPRCPNSTSARRRREWARLRTHGASNRARLSARAKGQRIRAKGLVRSGAAG
jgi:hypothetical protein